MNLNGWSYPWVHFYAHDIFARLDDPLFEEIADPIDPYGESH